MILLLSPLAYCSSLRMWPAESRGCNGAPIQDTPFNIKGSSICITLSTGRYIKLVSDPGKDERLELFQNNGCSKTPNIILANNCFDNTDYIEKSLYIRSF